ncbi:unnamed protein product [Lepeophtheirus salmonis]|uniref:(salmon louse) hypothetical protein n=1 Tax=Lepeophtheirus salmonis TaxID=72036 RepID=A0A7R8D5D8_LEPSM|nr:unnamed protein product [Lepeophtheirus salmonis]CAF3033539.1 unnamed protein product [Lepeophtheirus salmonis]
MNCVQPEDVRMTSNCLRKESLGVLSARLSQYDMLFSTFDYSTEHIKGTNNLTADVFSRLQDDYVMLEEDPKGTVMVQPFSQLETAESSILGNAPNDRELLEAIEAARSGDGNM